MDNSRHIWEGWTAQDFINELQPMFDQIVSNARELGRKPFGSNMELRHWCMDNQPYFKKYIPEVYLHFNDILCKKN